MRTGKFSGKLYPDEDAKNMPECGLLVNDAEASDPDFLKTFHAMVSEDCESCRGCPLYNEEVKKDD